MKRKYTKTELARWANKQRVLKQQGLLSPEKEKKLNAIPGWTWTIEKIETTPFSDISSTGLGPVQL